MTGTRFSFGYQLATASLCYQSQAQGRVAVFDSNAHVRDVLY